MKRTGLLGAVVAALAAVVLPALPAQADTLRQWHFDDGRGDAAPRADIWGSNATVTDTRYVVSTRIANLWGYGTYTLQLSDGDFVARVVVSKETGKPPTTALTTRYGGLWVSTPCAIGVTWDVARDFVSAQVPHQCTRAGWDPKGTADHVPGWVRFQAGGATDTLHALPAPAPGWNITDAHGDAIPRVDLWGSRFSFVGEPDFGVVVATRFANLWGQGVHVLTTKWIFNRDGSESRYRFTVRKGTGLPTVAMTEQVRNENGEPGAPGPWQPYDCQVTPYWDDVRDTVALRLPDLCIEPTFPGVATVYHAMSYASDVMSP